MTSSPTSGRSSPSTDRAVVESSSTPSWTSETTARAVRHFDQLAVANRVSTAFGISQARLA